MNKDFTIYNTVTGKILRRVTCPEEQGRVQAWGANEDLVTGRFDKTYRINPETFEAESLVLPYPDVPAYHMHDLKQYCNNDTALNHAIANIGEDPSSYRLTYWRVFRTWAYPPIEDYLDAQAKLIDPTRAAEGQIQLNAYLAQCIETKTRFPKPTT